MIQPPAPQPEPAAGDDAWHTLVADMAQHLRTIRDMPELASFRQTHALPRAFFEHAAAFYDAVDRLIELALRASGDDTRIHCAKGCANCCIDLVRGITALEIIHIYHHVRPWSDCKQLFEYHRDSAEQFSYILLECGGPGDVPATGDDPRIAEAHMRYNTLRRPCGFLDQQTGTCRIYPVRPLACRYFFSLDPPETCTPTHERYFQRRIRTVHLPPDIHQLLREIESALGFRPLNYLSGAFCEFTAATMHIEPIRVL